MYGHFIGKLHHNSRLKISIKWDENNPNILCTISWPFQPLFGYYYLMIFYLTRPCVGDIRCISTIDIFPNSVNFFCSVSSTSGIVYILCIGTVCHWILCDKHSFAVLGEKRHLQINMSDRPIVRSSVGLNDNRFHS